MDDDDFLEFRLGDDNGGIMRNRPSCEDGAPAMIRYVRAGEQLARISDLSASSDSLPQRKEQLQAQRGLAFQHRASSETAVNTGKLGSAGDQAAWGEPEAKYYQNELGEISQRTDRLGADDGAGWQSMETVGSSEVYNDRGEKIVRLRDDADIAAENAAASGYTRVFVSKEKDDDAVSVTSFDERTDHLFDHEVDTATQIKNTKEMLSERQLVAYAGLCRVTIDVMETLLRSLNSTLALESHQVWASRTMHKLYAHLDLSNDEQLMIEQLAPHGVVASDLAPTLCLDQTVTPSGHIVKQDTREISAANLHTDPNEKPSKGQDIAIDVRWTVLCDLFLNLVMDGVYDSRSRTLLETFARYLGVPMVDVCQFESKVTDAMQIDDNAAQVWTEDEIIEDRRKEQLKKKYAYIGLATVGGGLVIGLSAGLLAPVIGAGIAAGLTTVGVAGTGTFLAGAGGAALVTTTGAAIGAHVGNRGMSRRMGHVKTFEFRPLHNKNRVNVIITVSGWMNGKEDDVRLPFSTVDPVMGDLLSVYWEPEMMQSMGQTINILATEALTQSVQQILGATILTALMASIQLPMALAKLSYLLDNPWNVSLDRAWSAGLVLADTLMRRNLGNRPATLMGFSLGARVIYSCLCELARHHAYGLVQDVYIFGSPVAYGKKQFEGVRSVVSGRFVNGYSRKDWILGYLFRATSGGLSTVLGLAPIANDTVESMDVTELVEGHMSYRRAMPKLLESCGFSVLGDEFDEISEGDPEKLREKQRKLIAELNEEAAKDTKPSKFKSFFGIGKKKEWLKTAQKSETDNPDLTPTDAQGEYTFDVNAITEEVSRIEKLEPELIFDAADETVPPPPPYSPTPKQEPTQHPTPPQSRLTRHYRTASKSFGSATSQEHSQIEMSFDIDEATTPNLDNDTAQFSEHHMSRSTHSSPRHKVHFAPTQEISVGEEPNHYTRDYQASNVPSGHQLNTDEKENVSSGELQEMGTPTLRTPPLETETPIMMTYD